ncbi:unnamed protein product [Ostreobium quekettii]|uniref:Fatty acyl-CoA reductase n=1 Tax=Ostreobium quekettii TaxID=121088 RepID=A0A8S1J245_9CHLO|nr:unnamed protein product [Ostreobium quekettii]
MAQPQRGKDSRRGSGKPSEEDRGVSDAAGPLDRAAASALSVRQAFRGARVFLTGATGYLGSLVLEQVLRVCPEVDRVYVMSRGKKSASARDRVDRLLRLGLFHKLWNSPDVLAKVHVIEGDITRDGLNLSVEDSKEVLRSTTIFIHSAATVALDDHIQHALKNNYVATRNVLELCAHMTQLKAYLHVSTAFVGVAHDKGSTVLEKIYPLMDGDEVVDHQELAHELLRMPEDEAGVRCMMYLKRWKMANTYCLSKHLAEQLVASYHRKPFPVCIVRPSMIIGLAGAPYPGYLGNLAGGGGYTIAYALGFFEKSGHAWYPQSVIDVIPGDVASSVVLAAAASTLKGPLRARHLEGEPMIFHATSSTTYPATNYQTYLYAKRFFTKNPPPFCLLPFGYPDYPADYVPCPYRLWLAKSCTSMKVHALCYLMRLFGKAREAQRLYTGWKAWAYANSESHDFDLYFSCSNTKALDGALVEDERNDIRCLWTRQTGDWHRYSRTYMAGILKLFLRKNTKTDDHDFKFIAPKQGPLSRNP